MRAVVATSRGRLQGVEEQGVVVFRGIPFARAPVGPLRFQPPEPAAPWNGIRDARRFGPAAPQNAAEMGPLFRLGIGETAEDCLRLNVWTPAPDGARRPVLVWIHGGAFVLGAGSQLLYDGATLARRGDVVVVTINYRLGALGFLHLPTRLGGALRATGNEGLLDQIASLEWVRDEIASFGGDPGNVTIFGESAGSMSCATLLAAPRAQGLFHRAILQSGAANYVWPREVAAGVADAFLASLGAETPEALLTAPPERMLAAQRRVFVSLMLGEDHLLGDLPPARQRLIGAAFLGLALARRPLGGAAGALTRGLVGLLRRRQQARTARSSPRATPDGLAGLRARGLPFQPVVDGHVLPRPPLEAIQIGLARDVPLLVGTNRDEAKLFFFLDPEAGALDAAGLERRCVEILGSHAGRAVAVYRAARQARGESLEAAEVWSAIESDRTMRYPAMRLAEGQRAHQPRTYAYLFTWPSPFMGGLLGACHALELPFVFGTLGHPLLRPFAGKGPAAQVLAERIQDAWLAFARTGDPSHARIGEWPAYDATRRATMVLDRECRVELAPREPERAFWDSLPGDAAAGAGAV
jgi:para-nitrobenzyl esterase